MAKLKNTRHEAFCHAYCTELNGRLYNGTHAAIKAGYSEKTAAQQASRLLKDVKIKTRIDELKSEYLNKLEIDALWVLGKYKKIIEDDISNYLSYGSKEIYYENEDGEKDSYHKVDIDLKDSETVDTWNVSEISIGKDGQFKFKLHCKDKALAKMGEYLELFRGAKEIEEETPDDGFIEALNAAGENIWSDEDVEASNVEVETDGD